MARDLLVLSGGHPYEAEPFDALIHSLGDWEVTHLVHPEAEEAVAKGRAAEADALLFYDMGGYIFADNGLTTRPPLPEYRRAITERFESGRGAVALHHALAGWAQWPQWHKWLGGQFLYASGEWQGQEMPDSGYRHEVEYTARIVAAHPVTAGLPASFPVRDELYLCPIAEDRVTPLIQSEGYAMVRDNFFSAALAVKGRMFSREGWDHPSGAALIGWETRALAAPLIYLQFGDGPETYANPPVRQLIVNALEYTSQGADV